MIILALDTSSRAASCALLREDVLIGEFYLHTGLTHSETMMPMVDALLRTAGVTMQAVDLFAVSCGPGSFTGLRIGIASVKGMAFACGKPCAAVPTLDALAENLAAKDGYILPVMDARRSQIYTALYHCEGGAIARLREDAALSIEEVGRQAEQLDGVVTLVGDGAVLCMDKLGPRDGLAIAPENLRQQRAGSVARVAARRAAAGQTCSADALAPAYLRLPQAERERLARLQR